MNEEKIAQVQDLFDDIRRDADVAMRLITPEAFQKYLLSILQAAKQIQDNV